MTRNVRTYDHFCVLARALELVGERWTLLVVRDLVSGPKRFTDLMDRLGGITPKTLTQRLRDLGEAGIVDADRAPGRREVRYQLTPAGEELVPAVEDLAWWSWRHAWRPPGPHEAVHAEHLLLAQRLVFERDIDDRKPTRWHLDFTDDGDYTLACDGEGWSLTSGPPADVDGAGADGVDVTVVGPMGGWMQFVRDPTPSGAEEAGLEITGRAPAVRRLERLLTRFRDLAVARPD